MGTRLDAYSKPCQISKMKCLEKVHSSQPLPIFAKHSIVDASHSPDCASGLLKLLCCGFKRDTCKVDVCQTDYIIHSKLRILPYSEWKCNIQANKRLTKIKEI